MLTYLILTTRAIVLLSVFAGVITAYTEKRGNTLGKYACRIGAGAGLLLSILIAYLRNHTSLINSANLNGALYITGLLSFVLFLIFSVKKLYEKNRAFSAVSWIALSVLFCDLLASALPEVLGYPYQVLLSEKTVLSTDFLLNMIGLLLGLVLCVVIYFSAFFCAVRLSERQVRLLLGLELFLNVLQQTAGLLSVLQQKRIIVSNHTVFSFIVFVKNHSDLWLVLSMVLLLLTAAYLWYLSLKQKEPYRNPAEHRKIRAKWRTIRRWASAAAVAFVFVILNITVVEAMNTQEIVLFCKPTVCICGIFYRYI